MLPLQLPCDTFGIICGAELKVFPEGGFKRAASQPRVPTRDTLKGQTKVGRAGAVGQAKQRRQWTGGREGGPDEARGAGGSGTILIRFTWSIQCGAKIVFEAIQPIMESHWSLESVC
ncbi:hypothetical protein E2C01_042737 [Portunus trituberculatus]|uniref:Uncharacterized protein n=1 Tax=Portunus trituberculatus TaxID=210409 RepID=A0A5B7FND9_PORTR|nr:hypothetical protein [Portunus trituberculatus]